MFNKVIFKTLAAIESFKNDQRGVTAIEYAVIAVAVSALMLTVFGSGGAVESALGNAMDTVAGNINSAAGTEAGGTTTPESR
ncbi:Flp family type IVb pilin [Vibrio owensii]|uniref:Flp family type IVb pilin n=1 Tax=Vibrio owensii TaxID=696485 RepID=UPI003AAC8253